MKRLRAVIASLIWLLGVVVAGQAGALDLTQGQQSAPLASVLRFWPEDGAPLADKIARFQRGGFHETLAQATQGLDPYQPVWGAVRLTNATPDDGRPGDPWHVTSDIFGIIALDVIVVRDDGLTETLLSHSARAPFDRADYDGQRLRAPAFVLAPGESVLLLVKMIFGPFQSAELTLETPEEMVAQTYLSGMARTAFYAFTLAFLLIFAGLSISMQSGVGTGYAAVLFLGLCMIAYLDGFGTQFVYPRHPEAHLPFGLALMFTLSASGLWVAGHSVAGLRPRLARLFKSAGLVVLAGAALIPVLAAEVLAPLSYVALFAMICTQVVAIAQWPPIGPGMRVITRVFSWVCAGLALVLLMRALLAGSAGPIDQQILIKLFYAIAGGWTVVILTASLVDLRRQHARAVENELAALRREADKTRALLEAEQDYSRARDLAALRQRQLATASHDLKQPLMSLRLTMDALARDRDPNLRAGLGEAFDYMESLSREYLADTMPTVTPAPDQDEQVALSMILDTVAQMFGEEAISKGIALRTVRSSVQTTAPVMVLMRIVSNLVSNAVKHTRSGRVLVGVRRRAGTAELVIADTGPGMTGAEIDRLAQAYAKGEQSKGTGLGLSICFEIAAASGLDLKVRSTPGKGTAFALSVPRA